MQRLKIAWIFLSLTAFCAVNISFAVAQKADNLDDYNDPPSRFRGLIEKYGEDYGILNRFYSAQTSQNRAARMKQFYAEWLAVLDGQNFDRLNHDEQIDFILFRNYLRHEQSELARGVLQMQEISALVPFAKTINDLEDARRRLETIDPAKTAAILNNLSKEIAVAQQNLSGSSATLPKKTTANRAARTVGILRRTLQSWQSFYNGYDPQFTWWNAEPYKAVDASLQNYQNFLYDRIVGVRPDGSTAGNFGGRGGQSGTNAATVPQVNDSRTIIGDPIGREALLEELAFEMIPYTPEELVEIADKEFAWCEAEMKKASRAMGFGDDWKKTLEAVKNKYVEPGKQPELIRNQAYEAIEFVEKNNLVTVPKIARDGWRMEMMSPERQLVSPFFLGGETILVSYPTNTMAHEQKMMSMRGNNPHFTHAVTHHELIPGHHLQRFMNARYRPYRNIFYTPFSIEGWALYWEFLLWDLNFNKTPEDKVGALFWRMHRCARIIFSLNFHLGKMTPQEAVDFLVERVGHERDNATGEVRRSFDGNYGPLYQMAYMMGGLQFYQLHRDLVDSKKMTNKQFHDQILKEGPISVELVRAILTNQKLSKDFKTSWRFYGNLK